MKLSEIQSHSLSHRINVPFPVQWSEDDVIATATEKGIQLLKTSAIRSKNIMRYCCDNIVSMKGTKLLYISAIILLVMIQPTLCSDEKTDRVFGKATDGMPAAFGYFNTDTYTDLFVLTQDRKTVKILLGNEPTLKDEGPLLKEGENLKCSFDKPITSVVPGDFDGDAFLDVLITVSNTKANVSHINEVYVLWGSGDKLDCNISNKPLIVLQGQPLAIAWDQDMVTDLFGVKGYDKTGERGFWVFNKNRTAPTYHRMKTDNHKLTDLKIPHAHAFLDLNYDNYGDLYLTCEDGSAEVWLYDEKDKDFRFHYAIEKPPGVDNIKKGPHYMGQTLFQDIALEGKISQIIPVCFDELCNNSTIYVSKFLGTKEHDETPHWHKIKVKNLKDWRFVNPHRKMDYSAMYLNTLNLRAGDFNMDGYPDLLATLVYNNQFQTNLLENVQCDPKHECSDEFRRTFIVRDTLKPVNNNTVLGVFYDFSQDGVLDVLLVHQELVHKEMHYMVSAFPNSLDYDANFIKAMVLTGSSSNKVTPSYYPFKREKKIYGSNLPGPMVFYNMTTQEGDLRSAVLTQLPQSAYFSLHLPYTISGLGRTPNYIESLRVAVYGQSRVWEQLIPNSQLVITPSPAYNPSKWKVQLFVTPSNLIYKSFFALLGTCALIAAIIGGLYWKERKEDHIEKLQEAQKFHFDAM